MLKEEVKNIFNQQIIAFKGVCTAVKNGDKGSYMYHESQLEFFDGQSRALIGVTLDEHISEMTLNRGKSYGCDLENSQQKYQAGEINQYEYGSECMKCIGILSIIGSQIIDEVIS